MVAKIGTAGKQPKQSESPFCSLKNIINILLNLVTLYTIIDLKFKKLLSIQDEVEE